LTPAANGAMAQAEPRAREGACKQDGLGKRLALKLYGTGKQMEKLAAISSSYLQ